MASYQRFIASLLLCSVSVASAGCTSMKAIRPSTSPEGAVTFGKLEAGDTVVVRTKDGRTARFVVQQIEGDTIIAPDGMRYTSAEIAELRRRSFSGPKTAGLAAGIVAGVFVLVAAAAAAALDGLWGGG